MVKKNFSNSNIYGISKESFPPVLTVAEKMSDSKNVWFIVDIADYMDAISFADDQSLLSLIVNTSVAHRYVLMVQIEDTRGLKSMIDATVKWQQCGGTVIYCAPLSVTDVLNNLIDSQPVSNEHRMVSCIPSVSFLDAITLVDTFTVFGALQKLIIDKGKFISHFLGIVIHDYMPNPSLVVVMEQTDES